MSKTLSIRECVGHDENGIGCQPHHTVSACDSCYQVHWLACTALQAKARFHWCPTTHSAGEPGIDEPWGSLANHRAGAHAQPTTTTVRKPCWSNLEQLRRCIVPSLHPPPRELRFCSQHRQCFLKNYALRILLSNRPGACSRTTPSPSTLPTVDRLASPSASCCCSQATTTITSIWRPHLRLSPVGPLPGSRSGCPSRAKGGLLPQT